MFENWFSDDSNDAISLIKRDHDTMKDLFAQYENTEKRAEKMKIVAKALEELRIHTILEEQIFYPTVRPKLERAMMNEADEEHHVTKLLTGELLKMTGNEDHYDGKVKVLGESLEHHIKEEESEMLPEARKLKIDYDAMGQEMLARKAQLQANGIPAMDEERVADPSADSSAKAAKKTRKPKTRTAAD